jgi:hypothetical protein
MAYLGPRQNLKPPDLAQAKRVYFRAEADTGFTCGHENWVVPPGLESLLLLFPALKRWVKLVRPSGLGSR